MSDLLRVGSVIDYRKDRFATNGDHLDVRIIPQYGDKKGQHIDPATRQDLLDLILIGNQDNKRGLRSYQMTSGFGPRDTGIPGASKFHKGNDFAIASGNEIYVKGGQNYFSENGIGVASVFDKNGNPYEFEFFHTNVGEQTNNSGTKGFISPGTGSSEGPDVLKSISAPQKSKVDYSQMSKADMNKEYDKLRMAGDVFKAKEEGMKMHNAFFNK